MVDGRIVDDEEWRCEMYSRVTLFTLDAVRFRAPCRNRAPTSWVLPALRDQPGYEGVYVLVNPNGNGLVLSLWRRSRTHRRACVPASYAAQLDKFVTLFARLRAARGTTS